MSVLKSPEEIQKMVAACRVVTVTLDAVEAAVRPGITTADLDRVARAEVERAGARPAFLGYRGYPASLCVSVNEEVVHGVPGLRVLADGDIVSLDFGAFVDGWCGDCARTVEVGDVRPEARDLLRATRDALAAGIEAALPGGRVPTAEPAQVPLARARRVPLRLRVLGDAAPGPGLRLLRVCRGGCRAAMTTPGDENVVVRRAEAYGLRLVAVTWRSARHSPLILHFSDEAA